MVAPEIQLVLFQSDEKWFYSIVCSSIQQTRTMLGLQTRGSWDSPQMPYWENISFRDDSICAEEQQLPIGRRILQDTSRESGRHSEGETNFIQTAI